jgi:hypothetical protein
MPVNLEGVKDTVKALRKYDPELLKEMNKEIRGVMVPIRNKARSYAPSPVPGNLYNWNEGTKGKKITSRNSMFRTFNTEGRLRLFPLYDHTSASKGIYYSQAPTKRNNSGWQALYFVANSSASGSIYETAGRKNPGGDSKSKSNNPGAGKNFINRMGPLYGTGRDQRGRMIYRAWSEDQGKAQAAVIKAIETTIYKFNQGGFGLAA